MSERPNLGVSVAVIRDKQGNYLLVQENDADDYGLWGPSGGHIEEGEAAWQATVREVKEELNLDIKILNKRPVLETFIEGTTTPYSAYLADIIGGNIKLQIEELMGYGWFSPRAVEAMASQGLLRSIHGLEAINRVEDENPGH